jgi:hypothetical protein
MKITKKKRKEHIINMQMIIWEKNAKILF